MNFSIKTSLALCLFVFGASVSIEAGKKTKKKSESREKVSTVNLQELKDLLNEFLDSSVNPERKLDFYIDRLKELLKNDPKYAGFCKEIIEIQKKKLTNATLIGMKLVKHRGILPDEIKNKFSAKDQDKLLQSLTRRIK